MMKDDLTIALHELDVEPGQSIVSQLLEVQKSAIRQPRSLEWARRLKCLYKLEESTEGEDADDGITVLQEVNIPITAGNYVAVSYRQGKGTYRDQNGKSQYRVLTADAATVGLSEVSDNIIDRLLRYMDAADVPAFWIDQQCIEQEDPIAKEKAVQSMDLVYRCSDHPLGLLTTQIVRQTELDLLRDLISGKLIVNRSFCFERGSLYVKARTVLRLLSRLLRDPWWTRRWIFQEEYCTKNKNMKLLVPHTVGLRKSRWDKVSRSIRGEILVGVKQLRTQATLFCQVCTSSGLFQRQHEWRMLSFVQGTAKSYTVIHDNPRNFYEQNHCQPMSNQILSDLSFRRITEPGDTLAILANCCSYNVRLDRHKLEYQERNSLSLAMLTQWLLNGEIIWSKRRSSLNNNILYFLSRQTFDKFDPPTHTKQLTFMKKCRFREVHLLETGIQTAGHLWQIVSMIATRSLNLRIRRKMPKNEFMTRCLTRLIEILSERSYDHLAYDLKAYTHGNLPSDVRKSRGLSQVFDDMGLALAEAIANGEDLTVARHSSSDSSWAIFVGDYRPVEGSRSLYVLTASEAAQYEKLVGMKRSPDKYVSLLVSADKLNSGEPLLLSVERWVNGLTFPGSTREKNVLFKWPAVLQEEFTGSQLDCSESSDEGWTSSSDDQSLR